MDNNKLNDYQISQLGCCIEKYELIEVIGKGGFAEVFKAKCKNTDQLVAIKRISVYKISEKLKKRIKEEISIHSHLDHPSILKLFKYFKDHKYIYIVLELCIGDLEKYRQTCVEKRFQEAEARRFLAQILNGMLYLNNKNILHRDLKLANTLLCGTKSIKIADFGLATQLKGDDIHNTFCGTPNYMSPEIISREPQTEQMDVWSLGIMLYTMLVGKSPFGTNCTKETMKKIAIGEYDLPSYLSQISSDLIKKCILVQAKDRIRLTDMQNHPFLAPAYVVTNIRSQDSGLHTASITGNNTQNTRLPSFNNYIAQRNNYHTQDSRPLRTRSVSTSSPRDYSNMFDQKYFNNNSDPCTNISPVPPLMPLSAKLRSARGYGGSLEHIGTTAYPMKGIHFPETSYRPHYSVQSIGNVNVHQSGSGFYTKSNSGPQSYQDNGYSSERNMCLVENYPNTECDDPREIMGQVYSCCHGTHHHSSCERNENMIQKKVFSQQHMPTCNTETHSGILGEINQMKVKSSVIKSHLSWEGTLRVNNERPFPLSSLRLKEVREVKPFSVLNILENGEVCIEYIKNINNKRKVIEVWKISSDGKNIVVYRPNGKKGLEEGNQPPKEQGDISRYTYDSLPEKHWKKYSNAAIFAENVKAKTRKIIVRNAELNCYLMENGDVEVKFKNGNKFVLYSKWDPVRGKLEAKVNLIKGDKTYINNVDGCSFEKEDLLLYEKCREMRNYILHMEEVLKECENIFGQPQFPYSAFIGERENNTKCSSKETVTSRIIGSNKENIRQDKDVHRRNLRI